MGTVEEVAKMIENGYSEQDIVATLQQKGMSPPVIEDALNQAKIKTAVANPESNSDPEPSNPETTDYQESNYPEPPQYEQNYPNQEVPVPEQSYSPSQYQPSPPAQETFTPSQNQNYSSYGISTDLVNEIADQIISDKLSSIKKQQESVLEFKNLIETKVVYLEEKLKRIEAIIDRLELSVLQKVGEYSSNIGSIKDELIETQKTMKSLFQNKKSM